MDTLGYDAMELALLREGFREDKRTPNWSPSIREWLSRVNIRFPAPYCAAFVVAMLQNAAQRRGEALPTWFPLSGSCTVIGRAAKKAGKLHRTPEPGDVFLVKGRGIYTHTGFVTAVNGERFESIEGNTNDNGSAEGDGVYKRVRKLSSCDFVRVV